MEKSSTLIASQNGGANPGFTTRPWTDDATGLLSARDLIDQMHAKARQGAGVKRMLECFPQVIGWRMIDWMRVNGYIRNG